MFPFHFRCLLVLLLPLIGQAQRNTYSFINLSGSHGLADSWIMSMCKDGRGFIWLGTKQGLSRFDGRNFRQYNGEASDTPGLLNNSIDFVREYKPGHLLILSQGSLGAFNIGEQKSYRPIREALSTIYAIQTLAGTGYSLAMVDSCVILDESLQKITTLKPPMQGRHGIISCHRISDSVWLVGDHSEVMFFRVHSKTYHAFRLAHQLPNDKKLMGFLFYDARKKWYYFSNFWTGLYAYDASGAIQKHWTKGKSETDLVDNHITQATEVFQRRLWLGYLDGGISELDLDNGTMTHINHDPKNPVSLSPGYITAPIFKDVSGTCVVGTSEGISMLNNQANRMIQSWRIPLPDANTLSTISKGADGQIYYGIWGTAPKLWQQGIHAPLPVKSAVNHPGILSIKPTSKGLLLCGAGTTVMYFNASQQQVTKTKSLQAFFPRSDLIVLGYEDRFGNTWFSGNNGGGICRIPASGQPELYRKDGPKGQFSMGYYSSVVESANGDLWFGVNRSNKLLHWSRQENRFREVDLQKPLGNYSTTLAGITDLAIDGQGTIWIAFDGTGIASYKPSNQQAEQYTAQSGLGSNFVNALQFDNAGRLWAGTLKGLSCLTLRSGQVVNFSRSNGLPADFFDGTTLCYDSSTNRLTAVAKTMVMRFVPDSLLTAVAGKMDTYVDEVLVNGKRVPLPDNNAMLMLEPHQNFIQFRFAGADLENGAETSFSYRLEGMNTNWVDNGNSDNASFAALPPGRYTLLLRARHKGSQQWRSMSVPFVFDIAPPFYKTWLAKTLLTLAVVGLLFVLVRFIIQRQLQKQRLAMQMEMLVEQERNRMARDLHDGLGSMLSGIKHSMSAIQRQLPLNDNLNAQYRSNMSRLDESISELRQISHSMSSANIQGGLEATLRDYCREIDNPGHLSVQFEAINLQQLSLNDETAFHVFRMVQELLQNILKHAGATESIVQVSYQDDLLSVTVEDNGKGFQPQETTAAKGMGLKNIRERVRILGGRLDLQSTPGEGTSVMLEIPLVHKRR